MKLNNCKFVLNHWHWTSKIVSNHFPDSKQVKSCFADFEQDEKHSSCFIDFEQVWK